MCVECNRIICPDACPGSCSDGDVCYICGDAVLVGEEHFRGHGVTVCGGCADTVGADDLIDICSLEDSAELLSLLGFRHFLRA